MYGEENGMTAFLIVAVLGTMICVLGAINMTGNVSSLHWYHRQRVTEEDRKPFGRLVGFGTLLIGASMIVFGALYLAFERTQVAALVSVGVALLLVGVIVGLIISFYAMLKYNKGIF